MPLTGYLEIEDIPGESRVVGHEGKMEIVGLDWEVARLIEMTRGGGRRRARAEVEPMGVMKGIDSASPYLAQAALQGRAFEKAELTLRKDSGEAHLDYLVITMENVVLANYGMRNGGLEDPLTVVQERVELVFEALTYRYVKYGDDGSVAEEHEIEYDIARGV